MQKLTTLSTEPRSKILLTLIWKETWIKDYLKEYSQFSSSISALSDCRIQVKDGEKCRWTQCNCDRLIEVTAEDRCDFGTLATDHSKQDDCLI